MTQLVEARRVAASTAAVALVATLGLAGWLAPPAPFAPAAQLGCAPMPWELRKVDSPVVVGPDGAIPEINELGWNELRKELRSRDQLYPVETQVTGGHIAMRGSCYLGSTTAWIR